MKSCAIDKAFINASSFADADGLSNAGLKFSSKAGNDKFAIAPDNDRSISPLSIRSTGSTNLVSNSLCICSISSSDTLFIFKNFLPKCFQIKPKEL